MPDLCQPCHDRGLARAATLRLDGVPVCNACARGGDSAGVRRTFAEPVDVMPPTAEPKLPRRADRLPMHLTPEEAAELKAAGVSGRAVRRAVHLGPPLRSEHGTLCLVCSRPGTNVFHTSACQQAFQPAPPPVPAPAAPESEKSAEAVPDTYRTTNPNAAIVKLILEETAAALGMHMSDYRVQRKKMPYVTLRQLAAWLLRKHTALSMPAIGRLFGHQHHTTVINGVSKITEEIKTNRGLATMAEVIWKNTCRRRTHDVQVKDFQDTTFAEGQAFARTTILAGMRDVMDLMQAGAA